MSTAMLRQLGEKARPQRLAVSHRLTPNERPGRGPAFAYCVRAGDTLYAIARASGVPMAELMRRNPSLNGSHLRQGDRVWIPDLLPASAGEPADGLAHRAANDGEVRLSADRRFVAVLDSTKPGASNSLVVMERKSGKRQLVALAASDQSWKRIGWSPDGRLLAIEGLKQGQQADGGSLIAFDPIGGIKAALLTPRQALEDLRNEGHCPDLVVAATFRPIRDRISYRLAICDERGDRPLYSDWVMSLDGTERRRA